MTYQQARVKACEILESLGWSEDDRINFWCDAVAIKSSDKTAVIFQFGENMGMIVRADGTHTITNT